MKLTDERGKPIVVPSRALRGFYAPTKQEVERNCEKGPFRFVGWGAIEDLKLWRKP